MIEQLDLPVAELDKLTTAQLKTIQDQLVTADALMKKRKGVFEAALLRRFEKDARAEYTAQQKDTGTVRLAAPGSNLLELKVEVDKTVVWDQAKLFGVFNSMSKEDAAHYAKTKFEVAEDKYKNAPPAVKEKLKAARTVKAGKMKFSIVEKEIAAEVQSEAA
jgi:hypothetical protein